MFAGRTGAGTRLPDELAERGVDADVVLVGDSATGATACLRQMRRADAASVVLAVPVESPNSAARLRDEAGDASDA